MATVIDVTKPWSLGGAGTNIGGRTAVEVYEVLFDAPEGNLEYEAKIAPGVPRVQLDGHPKDPNLIATDSQVKMISPVLAQVTVRYGTPPVAGFRTVVTADGSSQIDQNPQVSWDTVVSVEETNKDYNGNPVRNSNGDVIMIQREISDPVLRVTLYRDYASVDIGLINSYLQDGGAVNSDPFQGVLAGQAHILKIAPELQYLGATRYWKVDYEIGFRRPVVDPNDAQFNDPAVAAQKAWYDRRPDMGYRVKVSGKTGIFRAQIDPANDGVIVSHFDVGWAPTPTPVYLDVNGFRVPDGGPVHWIYSQVYNSLPFAGLGVTI